MARVTVEDCLGLVGNQFKLVLIASHRARMLLNGEKPLIKTEGEKPGVIALREISAGLVDEKILKQPSGRSRGDGEYPRFLTDPEPDTSFYLDGDAPTTTMPAPPDSEELTEPGDSASYKPGEDPDGNPAPPESLEN